MCAEGLVRAFVKNGGTCMSMWRGIDTRMSVEGLACACIEVLTRACCGVKSGWRMCREE